MAALLWRGMGQKIRTRRQFFHVTILQDYPSRQPGVYVLFRNGLPAYVGQARELRSRLRDHLKKVENRRGITIDEVSCRFLTIERMWEVARAEDALIRQYNPEWNGIPGFSIHVPGIGCPGRPGYVNEWDRRIPSQGPR